MAKQSIKVDPNLINPDRIEFDDDIAFVKKYMRINDEGELMARGRNMPGIRARKLADRGVDVQGMLGGKAEVAEDYAKGGSASSRADGCCKRGKTRGKIY